MYKLILVDDEAEVRKGIIQKTEWHSHGFQVIGEAENGKEALEIIEKDPPDVVVTDIRMPIMDGLELASILKDRFPTVRIVILSGFDEFKYAQQAIKLDIIEYILKPVTSKDINQILLKVKTQIDEEIAHKNDIKTLKEHYLKSFPVMKDKFLTSLISTRLKTAEAQDKINVYDLKLDGNCFVVSVISIDYNSIKDGNFTKEDSELVRYAVLNISEEILNKHSLGVAFIHNDFVVVFLSFDTKDKDFISNRTFLILDEIRQNIQNYLKFTVTVGMGNSFNNITAANDSYKNAVDALDYRFVIGTNRVIFIEDLEQHYVDKVEFDEGKEQMLKTAIKVGTIDEIEKSINVLFDDVGDIKASIKDYQIYLIEILATIVKITKNLQLDFGVVLGINSNLFTELYGFDTIGEVKNWIKGICIKLSNFINSKRKDTCALLVENAQEYVNKNYSDNDLSTNKVCKFLHISQSYFTSVFKKETNETFLNYLSGIRLEAAKELLVTTNMKTSEIAEKVGYPDPHYFSYFFKKNYGVSPKEYKNSIRK